MKESTFPRSGNTLDLIFTCDSDRAEKVQVLDLLPGCDHYPTMIEDVFSGLLLPDKSPVLQRAWHKGGWQIVGGWQRLTGKLNLLVLIQVSHTIFSPTVFLRPSTNLSLFVQATVAEINYHGLRGLLGLLFKTSSKHGTLSKQ